MEILLLWESFSFVINLFGILVFVAMSWLYFDAIAVRRQTNVWLAGMGALVLALGFVSSIAGFLDIKNIIFGIGFGLMAIGVWLKPMSKRPEFKSSAAFFVPTTLSFGANFLVVIGAALAGFGYFRLVSLGMERHLKRLGWGMYMLSVSFLLGLRVVFMDWADTRLVNLIGDFQLLWVLEKIFLSIGLLMVGSWVFSYLLKRFETQLSLFLGGIVILVFGSSVVMYSFVIAYGYKDLMIKQSREVVGMTEQSIRSKQAQMQSQARLLAGSQKQVNLALGSEQEIAKKEVEDLAKNELLNRILVVDEKINPLLTWGGEGVDLVNGNFVVDLQTKKQHADIVVLGGEMYLVSGAVIENNGKVIGFVILGKLLDSSFLVNVGFERSELLLWVMGELRAKTNKIDTGLRLGIKDVSGHYEKTKELRAMTEANAWEIGGRKYFGVSMPMFDSRGSVLGSISTYHSTATVWREIDKHLIESYRFSMLLLGVMVLPAYLMARKLRSQIE